MNIGGERLNRLSNSYLQQWNGPLDEINKLFMNEPV